MVRMEESNMAEGRVNNSPAKPKKKTVYRTYMACKYSSSCFECPLEDCSAKLSRAIYLNALPEDRLRNLRMWIQARADAAKVSEETAISAPWLRRHSGLYG